MDLLRTARRPQNLRHIELEGCGVGDATLFIFERHNREKRFSWRRRDLMGLQPCNNPICGRAGWRAEIRLHAAFSAVLIL